MHQAAVGTSALSCVLAGGWIARELREASDTPEPRPAGFLAWSARWLSVGLTAGSACWLVRETLPAVSPELAEGLRMHVGWRDTLAVVVGVVSLAAGLAARASVPGLPPADRETTRARVARLLFVFLLGVSSLFVIGVVGASILSRFFPDAASWESWFDPNSPFWWGWCRSIRPERRSRRRT